MNEVKDLKWFQFYQNNSGGFFKVDDKVCHRLFIEAEIFYEAVDKAEELGCYWDGVAKGTDCPCCGDRWSKWDDGCVNLDKYKTEGYTVGIYDGIYSDTVAEWNKRYGKYEVIKKPIFKKIYSSREYVGKIKFNNIEEYAQYMADEFGWTTPDVRIYYYDGNVKEIFSKRAKVFSE